MGPEGMTEITRKHGDPVTIGHLKKGSWDLKDQ